MISILLRAVHCVVPLSATRFVYPVQSSTGLCDGNGARVMTINPDSSSTVFPAQNAGLCVGEHYEVEGSTTRSYYYLGGQRIVPSATHGTKAMRVDEGQSSDVYWLHSDHPSASLRTGLGSTSTLPLRFARGAAQSDINGNEVVTSTVRFYPYGEYRVTPTSDLTDKGFTGHAQNDEVALIYMRARYYVPGVGRFASADTSVPNPSSSNAFNRYAYAAGNPLLYLDPDGHNPVIFGVMLVVAGVAAIVNQINQTNDYADSHNLSYMEAVEAGFEPDQMQMLNTAVHAAFVVPAVLSGIELLAYGGGALLQQGGICFNDTTLFGAGTTLQNASSMAGMLLNGNIPLQQGPNSSPLIYNNEVGQGYSSFQAFKNAQGVAGEGQAWHHIVNQNATNVTNFGAERIHNTNNLIRLPAGSGQLHNQITGYYNSIRPDVTGSSSLRVREWLELQTFEFQWQFGIDTMTQFGGQQYITNQMGNFVP